MDASFRGLLLKRVAYGDADLILTILSAKNGLVSCFARAARRQKRAWSGLLSPGNSLEMDLSSRRRTGLPTVRQLRLIKDRSGALASPASLARAAYYLDLALRVNVEGAEAPEFLDRLEFALDRIEEPGMSRFMEWASIDQLGVLPPTDWCEECGGELGEGGAIQRVVGGGLSCLGCGRQGMKISQETLAGLRALAEGEIVTDVESERALARFLGHLLLNQLGVLESRRQAARFAAL